MRIFLSVLLLFLLLVQPGLTMSSASFQINWDSINTGGDDFATSESYQLNDTLGDFAVGTSTSELYALRAGYRAAESSSEALSLTIGAQESSTQVTYSAFSSGSKTVTVSSAGFLSVGDYIVAVENAGFSQKLAVGQVSNIASNVVTVDAWSGDQASMSASPAGGNDYVYRVGGTGLVFGTVTAGVENVATAAASVVSTATAGYTLYIQGDGLLRAGSTSIGVVEDGVVSVGSEEYGVSVTGTRAFGSGVDTAVTSTQRIIAQNPAASATVGDRVGMVFKLATTAGTTAGSYSQTVYYTLTANY